MSNYPTSNLIIDHELVDFELLFVNLEGRKSVFNTDGKRSFRIKFNNENYAKQLSEDGWNVKIYTPKNTEYDPYYCMDVKTKFKTDSENVRRDPKIYYVNSKNTIQCDAETIFMIDEAFQSRKVKAVDLIINPYHWGPNERGEGVTAYIDEMYAYVEDSPFANRINNADISITDDDLPF